MSEPELIADTERPVRNFVLDCPDCGRQAGQPCPGTVRPRVGCYWKAMIMETIDGTPLEHSGGTQFDGTQFDGLAEPFTVEGKSKLPQTPTERIDGAE